MMEELAEKVVLGANPISPLAIISHPDLFNEADDGLVTFMAFKETEGELAFKACEELHRRHARFLLAWCLGKRKETFGDSAESFVNLTFHKAYREADSFVCTDRSKGKEQVLAWLFKILNNLYLDSLRSEKRRPLIRLSDEDMEWLERIEEKRQEAANEVPTGRKAVMLKFLENLPPKDREILTVTAEYWDPEKGEAVIDDDVRMSICSEYGLTEASLRVRRKRLKDRAKIFVQEHAKLTFK